MPSLVTRYRCAPISAAITPGDQQHVDRVEARERRGAEVRAAEQEVRQERSDERAAGVDVDTDDRGPVRALVERQQVAGEAHRQRQDQQHDADHPRQLARVLVGAVEEHPPHVQEDQDDHHRRAPLVHGVHELAEEHVVVDVADRLVGAAGRVGAVVHRQEHPGDRLVEEREQRRRAERVGPVDPARNLAEQQPAKATRHRGALVEPVDDGDPGLDRRGVGCYLAVRFARLLRPGLEGLRERRCGDTRHLD